MEKFFHNASRISILALSVFLCFIALLYSQNPAVADCENVSGSYGYSNCASVKTFSDSTGHKYLEAISYAQRNRIVQGYDDGTFKPDNPINRAEFTKVLVEAILGTTPSPPPQACFPDIAKEAWFEKYVCYGKGKLFDGYPDGSFQPGNKINVSEASKILSNAFKIPLPAPKENEPWYGRYLAAVSGESALPSSIQTHYQFLTRGEMVEMIMRLNEKITTKASLSACDFVPERCENSSSSPGYGDQVLAETGVDMSRVRQTWIGWYNDVRQKEGLYNYVYNNNLNRSAYIWSQFSAERSEMSHKRIGQTEYYDYDMIKNWFLDLGLDFENIQRVTFTENIGAGPFSCKKPDCTQDLIDNIRGTFDFYMAEKNKDYRPHYNSVMNAYFKEIGLGIAVDEGKKKYYLTVHYGTRLL